MDNRPQSDDKVVGSQLENVSDAFMKKGKFPWLGCLSIILVLGMLDAIALPSFLSQAGKAKQSEAKQYLDSMNRAQKVKFAENGTFANSINELELGIKTETPGYKYSVKLAEKAAFHYGVSKNENTKSYVGGVFILPATNVDRKANKNERDTVAILCVAKSSGMAKPANPTIINDKLACGNDTVLASK